MTLKTQTNGTGTVGNVLLPLGLASLTFRSTYVIAGLLGPVRDGLEAVMISPHFNNKKEQYIVDIYQCLVWAYVSDTPEPF